MTDRSFKPRSYLTATIHRGDGRIEELGIISDSNWNWFHSNITERIRRWYMRHFLKLG